MPSRCVAANCSNVVSEGISLFTFPKDDHLRLEWTRQVQRTRADWRGPSATSVICSFHFLPECFDPLPSIKESLGFKQRNKRKLLPQAIPTVFSRKREGTPLQSLPTNSRRLSTAAQKLERKRVGTISYSPIQTALLCCFSLLVSVENSDHIIDNFAEVMVDPCCIT